MDEENKNTPEHINFCELAKEGVKQLIIRRGDALPLHHPTNTLLQGTISAPSRFIKDRHADFKKNKSHCIINRSDRSIRLELNEQSSVGNYVIIGSITLGNKLLSLNINSDCSPYTPKELSKKLKMLRSIFPDKAGHGKIVSALRNLEAKVNQAINSNDDTKGNVKESFDQTVESNIPESFKIKVPILEGEKAVEFEVAVILEVNSSREISCFLESIDAADMIEKEVDKRMDEEIELITEYAVIIEA
jgi:hypothetical protein